MKQRLHVATRQAGHAWVIDLQGDLTKSAEVELLELHQWEKGLPNSCTALVLNFKEVGYINSLGIAILIRIVRALYKAECPAFAFGLTPHYKKLFRMVGLTEYMTIYDDEYSVMQRISDL